MARKRAVKLGEKVRDLRAKPLTPNQTRRIKGGKRTVVFLVPPKEIPAK